MIIDHLINENPDEPIDRIPAEKDWLLFTIKKKSPHIKPLEFRSFPFIPNEKFDIIGWRYSDRNCNKVIYEGNFVKVMDGSVIISTEELSDNTMLGLSG